MGRKEEILIELDRWSHNRYITKNLQRELAEIESKEKKIVKPIITKPKPKPKAKTKSFFREKKKR